MRSKLLIRSLGIQPYPPVWSAMRAFTEQRTKHTPDELWLLQHDPVFTQGQAGRPEHILNPHQIPIVQTDRGGQITYHGPGQLVVYPLLDLNQKKISIRSLVSTLEKCVIQMLATYDVKAESRCQAPGVYIENKKICSIGLRVKKGCSFHGIALNVAMDLTPFSYINPCGYKGLEMTQLSHFVPNLTCEQMTPLFITTFLQLFGYTDVQHLPGKIYDL